MNRTQKRWEILSAITQPNHINSLSPDELAYLQSKGFDPAKSHNCIRSVVHTPEDRQEVDRIRAILKKLPDDAAALVVVNVIQPGNPANDPLPAGRVKAGI